MVRAALAKKGVRLKRSRGQRVGPPDPPRHIGGGLQPPIIRSMKILLGLISLIVASTVVLDVHHIPARRI